VVCCENQSFGRGIITLEPGDLESIMSCQQLEAIKLYGLG
jgi:hypothetical protein